LLERNDFRLTAASEVARFWAGIAIADISVEVVCITRFLGPAHSILQRTHCGAFEAKSILPLALTFRLALPSHKVVWHFGTFATAQGRNFAVARDQFIGSPISADDLWCARNSSTLSLG
jgi:hypothetical protein